MIEQVSYALENEEGVRHITITPVNQVIPGGNMYSTGVYKLSEGVVGLGEIVFDEDKNDWEYTGIGDDLTYEDAEVIAKFILNYEDNKHDAVYK